jgi:hypothetical protein
MKLIAVPLLLGVTVYGRPTRSQEKQSEPTQQTKIPAHAKVYIAPMGGFETPLKKAIADKKVPIEIVEQREQAEYEITGTSDSKRPVPRKK